MRRPKMPASVGPARLPSSGVSVWQATQARNTSAPRIAGERRRADPPAPPITIAPIGSPVDRIPAPDHAVGAAGEQRAIIGEERDRPDRQPRPDQRARELARRAVDDGDRAADAGGGNERAVARDRERDDRRVAGLDLAAQFAGRRTGNKPCRRRRR